MPECTCFCFLIVWWMWQVSGLGMGIIVTFRILHQFSIRSILPYISPSPIIKNGKPFSHAGCILAVAGDLPDSIVRVLCSVALSAVSESDHYYGFYAALSSKLTLLLHVGFPGDWWQLMFCPFSVHCFVGCFWVCSGGYFHKLHNFYFCHGPVTASFFFVVHWKKGIILMCL